MRMAAPWWEILSFYVETSVLWVFIVFSGWQLKYANIHLSKLHLLLSIKPEKIHSDHEKSGKVYFRCWWPIGQEFIIMRYCLHKIVSHSEMSRFHLKDFLILHKIFLRTDFGLSITCLVWFISRSDHLQGSNIRFDHNVSAYIHSLQSKKISDHNLWSALSSRYQN